MKFVVIVLNTLLALIQTASLQESKSTGYICNSNKVELVCPSDSNVVFSQSIDKYESTKCLTQSSQSPTPHEGCIGISESDDFIQNACGQNSKCITTMNEKRHFNGANSANCDFVSNIRNIFYYCIPRINASIPKFDVCDWNAAKNISTLKRGFVSSPGFPEYYGNSRDCVLSLHSPQQDNQLLFVYLVNLSVEPKSPISLKENDYLQINDEPRMSGLIKYPMLVYHNKMDQAKKVDIKFRSDWLTTAALSSPKGFLIYFEYYNTEASTTTTESSTTTIDFTLPDTTETTTAIVETTTTEVLSSTITSSFDYKNESNSTTDIIPTRPESEDSQIIINPNNIYDKQNMIFGAIISSAVISILVLFAVLTVIIMKKKKKVYDIFRFTKRSGKNVIHEYDIVETELTDDRADLQTVLPQTSSSAKLESTNETTTAQVSTNDSYFNTKLKKLYSDLDKTLQISYRVLNRPSREGTLNVNEDEVKIFPNRIYRGDDRQGEEQQNESIDSTDSSKVMDTSADANDISGNKEDDFSNNNSIIDK